MVNLSTAGEPGVDLDLTNPIPLGDAAGVPLGVVLVLDDEAGAGVAGRESWKGDLAEAHGFVGCWGVVGKAVVEGPRGDVGVLLGFNGVLGSISSRGMRREGFNSGEKKAVLSPKFFT